MATAFTQQERDRIREQLLEVALRYAAVGGSRRVTVDELAREAGISKGAFYGFYESKDHLFLDMVEHIHHEMYGNAAKVLEENGAQPISERVHRAIYEVYRVARDRNVIGFIREEVPLMLRRLPSEAVKALYRSDEEYIRDLIIKGGIRLNADVETVCTAVRVLLLTLQVKDNVGSHYDDAMSYIIRGACQQLVKGAV